MKHLLINLALFLSIALAQSANTNTVYYYTVVTSDLVNVLIQTYDFNLVVDFLKNKPVAQEYVILKSSIASGEISSTRYINGTDILETQLGNCYQGDNSNGN